MCTDHPIVLNAFTDENDNWSMSLSAQVLNFYHDLLLQDRNVLQVNGLKFRFVIWTCRDGKWLSRSLGHAGQASDYHCNRCLVNSDQTHLAAEPRTTEVHNSLAVYTAIKPGRLVGEELYHLCKGSKTIQISPIDIGLACYDELHMDINMSSVFVQLRQGIMTVCQEGQTVLPPAQNQKEYPSFKTFKTQKDEAVLKWQENEKKIINFLPQPKPWEESQRTLQT